MPSLGNAQTEPNRKVVKISRNSLRTEQPHLWQRVFALSLSFITIGFPLLFAPSNSTPSANVSILQNLLPLKFHGIIFMVIGITMLIGVRNSKHNYQLVRLGLSLALGYAIMWLLSLLYGAFFNFPGSGIIGLWTFFTYIILNTLKDPGFIIADLIREVRKHHDT